jgi:hypothetical protein
MRRTRAQLVAGVVTLLSLHPSPARAQSFVGTWVRQDVPMTMTVEMCCGGGRRLTYRIPANGNETVMILESTLDGKDAPVLVGGKPTGQTMAIRQIDDHHATAVMKVNGQTYGTATGTLSSDGKTLIVEDNFTAAVAGQAVGKQTEKWVRK